MTGREQPGPGRRPTLAAGRLAGLEIHPMDQADARAVAAWTYPGIYAFYDFVADADAEDAAELLDADRRANRYFSAALAGHGLIGFLEVTPAGTRAVEIGLGLRPDWAGRGLGLAFVRRLCDWVAADRDVDTITLRVASFNARAITVYERAGFIATGREMAESHGRAVRFVKMQRPVGARVWDRPTSTTESTPRRERRAPS